MRPDTVILIADDESLIALGLQHAFEDGGYKVRTVGRGVDAVRELNLPSHDIAGLITDIRMEPGLDGWDVARQAREIYPFLPVVYMSGDSSRDHTSRGVPDSIMIQKPFADAQMIAAISTLLNQSTNVPWQPA